MRTVGRPVRSAAGAMTEARRDGLDAIDPGRGWSMAGRVELVRAARSGPDGVWELVVR